VVVEAPAVAGAAHPLAHTGDGYFTGTITAIKAGDRYRYRPDGKGPFPDPASRFQPEGVHGPSEVIDPAHFTWSDDGWEGVKLEDLIVYELHVGTFTAAGTFAGVIERLPYLAELGVSALELMPLADFPGRWNWGYDGADLFAPARCYGRPDDLRRLVNAAHGAGLGVLIDVVYNHFGPDGNYLSAYSPYYFSKQHHTAWGEALNFDGDRNENVREFFIENALYWIHEYHADGLRLDATHAIQDSHPRKFLAELAHQVHSSVSGRNALLIAEDHNNLACMVQSPRPSPPPAQNASSSRPDSAGERGKGEGGWGLDGVWADDFHHQIRRLLAGDHEGYFRDFRGTVADLATTIRQGWFFTGQYSAHLNTLRGTDPAGIPPQRMIYCIQNHDQVGNRALGERLHQQIDAAAFRAASTLLLCVPETPLLFMGQEWAAATPFLFFTDHNAELGRLVTEGRRQEFKHFAAFSDAETRKRIPDPQDRATVEASRLRWQELEEDEHATVLRLYQALLHLRRAEPALRLGGRDDYTVAAVGESTVILRRRMAGSPAIVVVVQLRGSGVVDLRGHGDTDRWQTILSTEDERYSVDPRRIQVRISEAPRVLFERAGAVIFREPVGGPGFPA
jgi:maltooligosyltrehalose trehalohydrolase